MKTALRLSHSMLGLLVLTTSAIAAPGYDSGMAEDPYSQLDPDGVPLSVTTGQQQKKPSAAEMDAFRKQQDKSTANRDWLLHAYQQQKQLHNSSAYGQQNSNLYNQLSSNKALAKLAGLKETDPNNTSLKTGANNPNAALRKDSAPRNSVHAPLGNFAKPLISPLSSPAGVSAFAAPAPLGLNSTFSSILPKSVTAPNVARASDVSELDTPGGASSKSDPASLTSSDLSLDTLPGESIESARAHQDNFKAELKLPMDSDQMRRQQSVSTSPLAVAKPVGSTTATPPPDKTKPEDDPSAPTPIHDVPQINPVRAPIGNPFDILRR